MVYNSQQQAGFYLESVKEFLIEQIKDSEEKYKFRCLFKYLSAFEITSSFNFQKHPVLDVPGLSYKSFLRGKISQASWNLESKLADKIKCIQVIKVNSKHIYRLDKATSFKKWLLRAMHIIEPRINKKSIGESYHNSWERLESRFVKDYLYKDLPHFINNGEGDFFIQLLEPNCSLINMVTNKKTLQDFRMNFIEQCADFVMEFPYLLRKGGKRGICIEIDGPKHKLLIQELIDNIRDKALSDSNWVRTIRLSTSQFKDSGLKKHFSLFNPLLQTEYCRILYNNYKNPLYNFEEGLLAMELILIPMSVARIQFSIVKAILAGKLSFEASQWKIAVVERDVPCGELALNDFIQALKVKLKNEILIPDVQLKIYNTAEFSRSHFRSKGVAYNLGIIGQDDNHYDLLIDIAVLERKGLSKNSVNLNFNEFIQIRSAFSIERKNSILATKKD